MRTHNHYKRHYPATDSSDFYRSPKRSRNSKANDYTQTRHYYRHSQQSQSYPSRYHSHSHSQYQSYSVPFTEVGRKTKQYPHASVYEYRPQYETVKQPSKSNTKLCSKVYQLKDILSELQFDNVSIYSVTSHFIADYMTEILLQSWEFYGDKQCELHILDGMACVGLGNTFSFLNLLWKYKRYHIYINEQNQARYAMLKNNINTLIENNYIRYNSYQHNIYLYNNDVNKLHYYLDYDLKLTLINVIFLDPEWGGKQYKEKIKLRLKIGEVEIEKVVNTLFNQWYKNLKIIALKLPLNYDWKYFKDGIEVERLLLMQINFVNQSLMLCIKCDSKRQYKSAGYHHKFCSKIANVYFQTTPENVRIL